MGQADTATNTVQSSARVIGDKAVTFAEQNVRSAFDYASKVVRVSDMQELMALQSDYVKAQIATLQEQAKDFGSTVQSTIAAPSISRKRPTMAVSRRTGLRRSPKRSADLPAEGNSPMMVDNDRFGDGEPSANRPEEAAAQAYEATDSAGSEVASGMMDTVEAVADRAQAANSKAAETVSSASQDTVQAFDAARQHLNTMWSSLPGGSQGSLGTVANRLGGIGKRRGGELSHGA